MLHLFTETKIMGSTERKSGLYSQLLYFLFCILAVTKFSSIGYSIFIPFYVYRNNNVLRLRQYHQFVPMEMLLVPETVEPMLLLLRQTSKAKTWVLRYFHMLVAFFFFKLWQAPMSKTFYLTCVYLNYIQGSKSSSHIAIYS
jgi:hypothetical protein